MSLKPSTRIEFKENATQEQVLETATQIKSIAGSFNVLGGNPPALVIPTTDPVKLAQIRALPYVAKVGNQF